jgi:hypothetical protein
MVTLSKPGPQIDAPCSRPTRGLVASNFKRSFCRLGQFRCAADIDVVSREKAKQMRNVPVVQFGCARIPIFQPFLELSCASDLKWREPCTNRDPLGAFFTIDIQNFGSARHGGEEFAENLLIHRRPHRQRRAERVRVFRG